VAEAMIMARVAGRQSAMASKVPGILKRVFGTFSFNQGRGEGGRARS